MKVNDFDFYLPQELIAQKPLLDRTSSKLLVVDKTTKRFKDEHFFDITKYLHPGDVLVLNDTKVLPARIFGVKADTLANIEILLLKELLPDHWEALAKPARRLKVGSIINFTEGFKAQVVEKKDEGIVVLEFMYDGIFLEHLSKLGQMPLPPYITEKLEDQTRYQTVYANHLGSAAAPTAGLHFTQELLKSLEEQGIEILYVTLHIGLDTFRPVSVSDINEHKMHSEHYEITAEVANRLNKAKAENRRIISVGTTTVRALESNLKNNNSFKEEFISTDIFIYPGFNFQAIDGLITNFHLPKSTLLMLVSAFSSRELMLQAYDYAIKNEYRFFSFGDAMFIK